MRKLRVSEILITSAFGTAALAGLSAAVDVPEGAAALSGAGLILAAGGIYGSVRPPRSSPGSRKPDYRRIAELEQDVFGQIYEHEGAPHVHFYRGDSLPGGPMCRCGQFPKKASTPLQPPRPLMAPTPPPLPAHPIYRNQTFYIATSQAQSQVQIGGGGGIGGSVSATGWDGWSVAAAAVSAHVISVSQRADMTSLLAASGLEPGDELKALMNWPRCPGCGKFGQGSTARPQLCASCREAGPGPDPDGR